MGRSNPWLKVDQDRDESGDGGQLLEGHRLCRLVPEIINPNGMGGGASSAIRVKL